MVQSSSLIKPSSLTPVLECRNLSFRYFQSQQALNVDSFVLMPGEKVFVHGPSGSGKSTFLNLCAGVLKPQAGQVMLMGQDLVACSQSRCDALRVQHMGFVFQQFNLLPYLSVLANVCLPAQLCKARRSQAKPLDEAMALLCALGLEDQAHKPAALLSVGQQQRVAVARALIGSPALIVADEPTSALDEAAQAQFMSLLNTQLERTGAALLMVSHDLRLSTYFDRSVNLVDHLQGGA